MSCPELSAHNMYLTVQACMAHLALVPGAGADPQVREASCGHLGARRSRLRLLPY
jgi:hypothetical protein